MSKDKYAYYNGENTKNFERLTGVSVYNSNYYKGVGNDLLYALSDDDMTTEWFVIRGSASPIYIGYSTVSGGPERLVYQTDRPT